MSTLSRRTLLSATALGLGAAGLVGCAPSGGTGPGGQNGSGAAPWPTYAKGAGPTPDRASSIPDGGGWDAYFRYPTELTTSVAEPPGDGSPVQALLPSYAPPPAAPSSNRMWSAINEALNFDVGLNIIPNSEYSAKLATITASNDLPDIMTILSLPRAKQFVKAKCADLTEYLSGDAIAAYPNLAALPTYAWQAMGRVDGGIYGVPLTRGRQPSVLHVNRDALDSVGAADPWDRDQFSAAMREVTGGGRYGFSTYNGEPFQVELWAQTFGAPNRWQLDNGTFTPAQTTPQYLEAIEFARQMYADKVFHPGSLTLSQNDMSNEYYAQQVVGFAGNLTNYATGIYQERIGGRFTTDIADCFAPDYRSALAQGLFGYTVIKQADPERVKALLRLLDYLAAPYGSKEWELLNYGVEGVHFTRDGDGQPELLDLADAENGNTVPFKYISTPQAIIQVPGDEASSTRAFDWFERAVGAGVENPAVGLDSDTFDREWPTINKRYIDATIAVVTGREQPEHFTTVADEIAKGPGAAIAEEFAASYAADGGQ